MVRNKKKIVVVGGGGFTHKSDKDLDDFVLNQVNKSDIEIGFLPTASDDAVSYTHLTLPTNREV